MDCPGLGRWTRPGVSRLGPPSLPIGAVGAGVPGSGGLRGRPVATGGAGPGVGPLHLLGGPGLALGGGAFHAFIFSWTPDRSQVRIV